MAHERPLTDASGMTQTRQLGPWIATALVIGNMIGSGIGIVRLIRLDPKNLQSRTIRLQVDATRPGRRLGFV